MKKVIHLLTVLLISQIAFSQSSNPCVSCNNNVIDTTIYSSAIGSENISTGLNSFAGGFQNEATGDHSTALGNESQATAESSFAAGYNAIANGKYSVSLGLQTITGHMGAVAIGFGAEADNVASIAIGKYIKTLAPNAITFGSGYNSQLLENSIQSTMMIGFNSTLPTFFVSTSPPGGNKTGKIGIGNITAPEAKLHIKADNNEDASILLQPTGANYYAKLLFGENGHQISAKANEDLKFSTGSGKDFVFENGYIGIDTENPIAKLQVKNGDIFIEDIDRGIVMKSPDGNCWRGTLDNSGTLNFVQVNCDNLLTYSEEFSTKSTKQVKIFPNPASNKVFISIDHKLIGSFLEIIDINGKVLYTEVLANNESHVEINDFKSGVFMFNIKNENGIILESVKVVKK